MGGALGGDDLPSEPNYRMLATIKDNPDDPEFSFQQLRVWMLRTQPDDRPKCLQNINPFQV